MEKSRPRGPWIVQLIMALAFLVLYVPLIAMVVGSFLVPSGNGHHVSFAYYRSVFSNGEVLRSLGLSLWIAFVSTIIASCFGTMGALALERLEFPGKRMLAALTLFPLVMPELVMGLSLLIWFVFLRITLGTTSIILAHVTFCLSYVIVIVRTRLKDFDVAMEEAAADLGATPWRSFWTVTFPLIFPGILAAALVAFTLSFDDFLITFYTAGVGSDTLPVKLYSMIKLGISPELNAMSTLLLILTVGAVLVLFKPQRGVVAH